MAFSITDIRSNLQYGGARPTLFKVLITPPPGIGINLSRFSFFARATQLPASDLGTIQVPYFGRKYKIAGDRTFAAWSTTIMNDEDFELRQAVETWSYQINSHEGNKHINMSSPADYKSTAEVYQYNKSGDIIRVYKFDGIYPETVSTIDLDWNASDQIEEFSVTWQYDYFEVTDGDTGLLGRESIPEREIQ